MIFTLAAGATALLFQPPLGNRPSVHGQRTVMLNLGSPHLAELPQVTPAMLEPLLARLQKYAPTIITHEGMSGEQCHWMRQSGRYAEAVETYCWDGTPAQKLAGLTQPEAENAAEVILAQWRSRTVKPTASERRKLTLLFLAAGDRGSAWVQWLRLPVAERRAADGLDTAMVDVLDRKGRKRNESYDIASVLAARLGLERTYAVDDHSSDGAVAADAEGMGKAMSARFGRLSSSPQFHRLRSQQASVRDAATLLDHYRLLNQPGELNRQIQLDFGGALADAAAAPYGRWYVAWWETRNLRMLANIRAATATQPGVRVLNLVGASHKPWYDAGTRQFSDVELRDVEDVLR